MPESYLPDRGHLVWLDFDPQLGREQAGRRPALVLSPGEYNTMGLMICCPVTRQIKGLPFEVAISGGSAPAVALADHVKSLDWRQRRAEFFRRVEPTEVAQERGKLRALV